jgi:hypothetical protein
VAVEKPGSLRSLASARKMLAVILFGAFGLVGSFGSVAAATSTSSTTSSRPSAPLVAPKTSVAQDRKYLTDVTVADPGLVSYEQKEGNVALRALLTDGSAFCALLKRGREIDEALVDEATGVRSTESQTHLPLKVATFNTIEAVALLTLCPSEQRLVPASVRSKIHSLGKTLTRR